ncbi:MAG TPA: methyl-accepting chemotaxis protein [Pirellulales bacterium]|jgi:methyl-accepting chemotaxis protein WspA
MSLFREATIKAKLYGIVLLSAIGLAAVLTLALFLLMRFGINGPLYQKIMLRKSAMAEFEPCTLFVVEPYLTLIEIMGTDDSAEQKELMAEFYRREERCHERQSYWMDALFEGPVKQALRNEVNPSVDKFFHIANDQFLPLIGIRDHEELKQAFDTTIEPAYTDHRKAIDRAVKLGHERTAAEQEEAEHQVRFWVTMMVILSVGTILLVILLGLYLAYGIVRSTGALVSRINEMASGASDLTARITIESKDEIGELGLGINAMIAKIHAVVAKVRESSLHLLSTASQIAATSKQQENTVQDLSSSTTEIAAAVREISATGKELSGTMSEVNERANQAATLAAAGRSRLIDMESTMQQLVESTASISTKLALIREKADNINVVVTTITKVADQTNLLSINAAIEAEKAGEYGRGFLVVAREIRRLADQTAVATLDIENMVRHMHDAVSAGVMQMDKFSEEVRLGVGRVGEINSQIGQITEEVRTVSDRFRLVNEGMHNQSIGAEQINEAMLTVSSGTKQTVASLDEFNKATAHLRESVKSLNEEIAQFKT